MFILKRAAKNKDHTRFLIAETYRVKGKVKQKIIRSVGVAKDDEDYKTFERFSKIALEAEIRKKQKCDLILKYSEDLEQLDKIDPDALNFNTRSFKEEKRVQEGIEDVYGNLFDSLGFSSIFNDKKSSDLLKILVVSRILDAKSKLKTSEILEKDCNKKISSDTIYRLMDKIFLKEEQILKTCFNSTIKLFDEKIDVLFFDVTTLYYESIEQDEELKAFGFSKDCKFNQVQVVLALATTIEGLPVGYKLFRGNTAETKTLISCLNEWKKQIPIENVMFVGDRAMFNKENIYELENGGYKYIIACKLRSLTVKQQQEILNAKDYELLALGNTLSWKKEHSYTTEIEIKNEQKKKITHKINARLITTYNSSRAEKDLKDRQRMLDKIKKHLSKITEKAPTQRLVTNAALKKFCLFEGSSAASIDAAKVTKDELWDGMHGVITNSDKSAKEILLRYKELWQIEESFRISKTNLKVRPIYHFKPKRIRAHVSICFLSLCLFRHLQVRLKRAHINYSFQKIQEELKRVQYSICRDSSSGLRFKIPSSLNPIASEIYAALGIQRKNAMTVYQN